MVVVAKHLFGPRLDYRLDVNRFINCIYLTPSSSVNSTESISVKLAQHLLKGEQITAEASARKSIEMRDNVRSDGKLAEEINPRVKYIQTQFLFVISPKDESEVHQQRSNKTSEKMDLQSDSSRCSPTSSPHFDAPATPKDSRMSPRMDTNEKNGTGPQSANLKNHFQTNPLMLNANGHSLLHNLPFHPMSDRPQFRFAEDMASFNNGPMGGRYGDSLIPKGDPMEARLQEMLRYNMDKYANQNLDTLHISRRVRELLSVHNVGQRLFAKYVLGLSQGTVSELLSKPKPWDKLTEKGRDSYRKMHAWACDEDAVLLLKSLIPKKCKYSTVRIRHTNSRVHLNEAGRQTWSLI